MTVYQLGEIAINSREKRMPEPGDEETYIGLEHLDTGRVDITRYGSKVPLKGSKLVAKKGDVLFGRRNAYLKRSAVAPFDCLFSAHGLVLRPNPDVIDPEFFPFFMSSEPVFEEAIRISVGSLSPTVNWSAFKDCSFDLPSMNKQKELAAIMRAASKLKTRYSCLIDACDDLVKSRFIEMFGTQYEFAKWDVARVEDVADVTVGVVIKPAQYYVEDSSTGIKAFRSLNVGPMKIKDADWVYFSAEGNKKNSKSILQEGDVLIVRSGYPGTSCVVPAKYAGSNAIDLIIARPNMAVIEPGYLCAFNNYPHGQQQIQQGVGGAAQQHFNVGKYKKMKIPVPPINLQRGFVSFANQVNKSKFDYEMYRRWDAFTLL